MVQRKIPNGTYVLLMGLTSKANNGLFGTVEGLSDGRVSVKICETNKVLKVRPECVIFPDGIRALVNDVSDNESEPMITAILPELKKAHSLLIDTHQASFYRPLRKSLLQKVRDELASVAKSGQETSSSQLRKQINFMLADVCRFDNDCDGIINAVGKHFPIQSSEETSADEAWNDYPVLGMSVCLALQNLAAAIGMSGNLEGERELLIHAVDRFRRAPPPRLPLDALLVDIANAMEHQVRYPSHPHFHFEGSEHNYSKCKSSGK